MMSVDIVVYGNTTDKIEIVELCGNGVDHRIVHNQLRESMGDSKFKKFLGDEKAKAIVSIRETLGGPNYSSIQVHVGAEILCNQDEKTIELAQTSLYDLCLPVLDTLIRDGYEGLVKHIEQLHESEEDK